MLIVWGLLLDDSINSDIATGVPFIEIFFFCLYSDGPYLVKAIIQNLLYLPFFFCFCFRDGVFTQLRLFVLDLC